MDAVTNSSCDSTRNERVNDCRILRAPAQELRQRAAGDELQRQKRPARSFADFEDLHDVRVLQLAGEPRLVHEHLDEREV